MNRWNEENNPIYNSVEKIKYLGINSIKEAKETTVNPASYFWEKTHNKVRHPKFIGQKLNIAKLSVLPKVSYRFSANPTNIPMKVSFRSRKCHPKIYMVFQRDWSSQNNLENQEQNWISQTFWFQRLLQSYSNQNIVEWQNDLMKDSRNTNQCKKREILEINTWV